jgi:hypothetical protein
MHLTAIYAQLACSDPEVSTDWFSSLFNRAPDSRPMKGLAEWHLGATAGFQLFRDAGNAGHGTLTLIVQDVRREQARLADAGRHPGEVSAGDFASLLRLRDPDGNLVVLAQPEPPTRPA